MSFGAPKPGFSNKKPSSAAASAGGLLKQQSSSGNFGTSASLRAVGSDSFRTASREGSAASARSSQHSRRGGGLGASASGGGKKHPHVRHALPFSASRNVIGQHGEDPDGDPLEFPEEAELRRHRALHDCDLIDGGAALPLQALMEATGGALPEKSELAADAFDALAVLERVAHTRRILETIDCERGECRAHIARGQQLVAMNLRARLSTSDRDDTRSSTSQKRQHAADFATLQTKNPGTDSSSAAAAAPAPANGSGARKGTPPPSSGKSVFSRLSTNKSAKGAASATKSGAAPTSPAQAGRSPKRDFVAPSPAAAAAAAAAGTPPSLNASDVKQQSKQRSRADARDDNTDGDGDSASDRISDAGDEACFAIPERFAAATHDPNAPVIVRTQLPDSAMRVAYEIVVSGQQPQENGRPLEHLRSRFAVDYASPPRLQPGLLQQRGLLYRMEDPFLVGFDSNLTSTAIWQ